MCDKQSLRSRGFGAAVDGCGLRGLLQHVRVVGGDRQDLVEVIVPLDDRPVRIVLFLELGFLLPPMGSPSHTPGSVYLVLGSDTAIWEGMDTSRYHCHYDIGLYTNQTRNAYKVMDKFASYIPEFTEHLKHR